MAIDNSEAVRFVNEQVRPLCEEARALKARIDALSVDWFGGLNALVPNSGDMLEDGREAEGVSRLTGAHVNSAMGDLITAAGALNDTNIARPCVRPLEAG